MEVWDQQHEDRKRVQNEAQDRPKQEAVEQNGNPHQFQRKGSLLLLSRCGVCLESFAFSASTSNTKEKEQGREAKGSNKRQGYQCKICGLLAHESCITPALYRSPFPCKPKEMPSWLTSLLPAFVSPTTTATMSTSDQTIMMKEIESEELYEDDRGEKEKENTVSVRRSVLRQSLDKGVITMNEYFATEDGYEDVFMHIFSFLSFDDLMASRLTCRKWNTILNDDSFWHYQGFRFCMPGMGVYLTSVSGDERQATLNKRFPVVSKPITIGLCGPQQVVESILNFWVGELLSTSDLLAHWDRTHSLLPEIAGMLKARNQFFGFQLKICVDWKEVSKLKHVDGFIIAFELAEGARLSLDEEIGVNYDDTKMRQATKEHAAECGLPYVACRLGYKQLLVDPSSSAVDENWGDKDKADDEEDEEDINLDDEDTTDGEWCIVKKDNTETNGIITLSNQRSAFFALLHVLNTVSQATGGFSMVPTNNPSWDEAGQRDLSVQGRIREAVILLPAAAEETGKVACSTALFVGEVVVIVPTCTVVGVLAGVGFTASTGNFPLMMIGLGLGAIMGTLYGAWKGITIGYHDAVELYNNGWDSTYIGKTLQFN